MYDVLYEEKIIDIGNDGNQIQQHLRKYHEKESNERTKAIEPKRQNLYSFTQKAVSFEVKIAQLIIRAGLPLDIDNNKHFVSIV